MILTLLIGQCLLGEIRTYNRLPDARHGHEKALSLERSQEYLREAVLSWGRSKPVGFTEEVWILELPQGAKPDSLEGRTGTRAFYRIPEEMSSDPEHEDLYAYVLKAEQDPRRMILHLGDPTWVELGKEKAR